jgi:hypothetical protein
MSDLIAQLIANVAAYFDDPYWTDAEVHNVGVLLAWTGGIILAVWIAAMIPAAIRETREARAHNARLEARAEAACRQADADLAAWIADAFPPAPVDEWSLPADLDVFALCRVCASAPVMDEAEARADDDPTCCLDCNRAAWDRLMAGDFSDYGLFGHDLAPADEPAGWEGAPTLLFGRN